MRICLLGRSDLTTRSESSVLARRLAHGGHDVIIVCGDGRSGHDSATVTPVARRLPAGGGRLGRLIRRAQPQWMVRKSLDFRLVAAARATEADLFYPAGPTDVALARSATGPTALVATQPYWQSASRTDLAWSGAVASRWTSSPAGPGLLFPTPPDAIHPSAMTIGVAYRRTGSNPGRYLESALVRAGCNVIALTDLNWEAAEGADAVIIVESPLPQLAQKGVNPGVPVIFWVHHGEQHIEANVRLARLYEADAVLMAHSLHLAHRFSVPVHRFPFGIAPELGTEWIPFAERTYDAALIGSGTESKGGRYRRRADLVRSARRVFGDDRVRAGRGLSPKEIADVYRNSRIVINDGGDRHLPITMRVMEAIGSGALLLSDPAPGLDSLFEPGVEFVEIVDGFEDQLRSIIKDPGSEQIARAGHQHGLAHHTYDERARRAMIIAASTVRRSPEPVERSDLESVLDRDPDVETIAGLPDPALVIDHVVDGRHLADIPEGGVDAAFVTNAGQLPAARVAARLFVYGPPEAVPDGEATPSGLRRLDVRAKPKEGYSFGGISYRLARSG